MALTERINIRISKEDLDYLHEQGINSSALFRNAIKKHRGEL